MITPEQRVKTSVGKWTNMGLNDYRVIKELGRGGFGNTYLVEAINLIVSPK
jgi:serine/threonine protein kinase